MKGVSLSLGLALLAAGCIQGTPEDLTGQSQSIKRHVLKQAPEFEHRLGAKFGSKVVLLGYDLSPEEITAGKTIRLTWYWHCLEELGEDWSLFTHMVNARTGRMCYGCNFDNATTDNLRNAYQPSKWKAGEYIRDIQRITLPDKIPFEEAEFRVGLYQGDSRLRIVDGPRDDERRARGPRFMTGYEPPPVSELVIPLTEGTLTIDGVLDEPEWLRAAKTKAFVAATTGERQGPRTEARLLYDSKNLYVGFDCDDDHLHSTYTKRDDPLWKQDAVEIFIDPPGSGRDYVEFQVSPAGVIFDTRVHQHPKRDDSYDGNAKAAVKLQGTLNDESDRDRGWTAELAIPLASTGAPEVQPGQQWRLNLFRLDDKRRSRRAFLAWSAPLANSTHVSKRFGKVTFGPLPHATEAEGTTEAGLDAEVAETTGGEGR